MFTMYSVDGISVQVDQDQVQSMLDAGYTLEQQPDPIVELLENAVTTTVKKK